MLNELKKALIQSRDYVPQNVINRRKEKNVLTEWAEDNFLRNILITSPSSGTGKTVTVKWFFKKKLPEEVESTYILCDGNTKYGTYKRVAEELEYITNIEINSKRSRGDLSEYIRNVFNQIDEKIILCLDEIDYVVNKYDDDILSTLLHIQRETQGNLHLILISNDYSLKDKLQTKVKSRLNEISVLFDQYEAGEAANILEYYIKEVGLVKEEYIEEREELHPKLVKFAKEVPTSDMRKLLQSFIVWVEMCENKLSLEKINQKFFDKIMKNETLSLVGSLDIKEKVILLSIIKSKIDEEDFKDKKGVQDKYSDKYYYTTFKKLKKYYHYISEKTDIKSLKDRRIRHYLERLDGERNIVKKELKSFGRGKGMKGIYHLPWKVRDCMDSIVKNLIRDLGIGEEWVYNIHLQEKLISPS